MCVYIYICNANFMKLALKFLNVEKKRTWATKLN